MKNIHLIPTDKPSRLHLGDSGLVLCDLNFGRNTINGQNIYITSDEEIKEGDWYFLESVTTKNMVLKANESKISTNCKKIILTTDQDLIKDGVQAIDDEFLQWFIQNQSCEEVEIIKNYLSNNGQWKDVLLPSEWEIDTKIKYKIIIPREEPKQETLEEVAKKQWGNVHRTGVLGFIEGAKYQAKSMYSEEEVNEIIAETWLSVEDNEGDETFSQARERILGQFKKTKDGIK
jgi:hypothetical protein